MAAVLAAFLAYCCTFSATVVVQANISAVAADSAIIAPAGRIFCAFFAKLAAILTDQRAVAACLAARLADLCTF